MTDHLVLPETAARNTASAQSGEAAVNVPVFSVVCFTWHQRGDHLTRARYDACVHSVDAAKVDPLEDNLLSGDRYDPSSSGLASEAAAEMADVFLRSLGLGQTGDASVGDKGLQGISAVQIVNTNVPGKPVDIFKVTLVLWRFCSLNCYPQRQVVSLHVHSFVLLDVVPPVLGNF
jgi:hypothetical protein